MARMSDERLVQASGRHRARAVARGPACKSPIQLVVCSARDVAVPYRRTLHSGRHTACGGVRPVELPGFIQAELNNGQFMAKTWQPLKAKIHALRPPQVS
jgi:hypothetical protein